MGKTHIPVSEYTEIGLSLDIVQDYMDSIFKIQETATYLDFFIHSTLLKSQTLDLFLSQEKLISFELDFTDLTLDSLDLELNNCESKPSRQHSDIIY